jgi:hypothetical protein
MSIALLIKPKDGEQRYVPVSTESMFNAFWLPVSERLGLSHIPDFRFGTTLSGTHVPELVAEFTRLRDAMQAGPVEVPDDAATAIAERLSHLLSVMGELDTSADTELFIG